MCVSICDLVLNAYRVDAIAGRLSLLLTLATCLSSANHSASLIWLQVRSWSSQVARLHGIRSSLLPDDNRQPRLLDDGQDEPGAGF